MSEISERKIRFIIYDSTGQSEEYQYGWNYRHEGWGLDTGSFYMERILMEEELKFGGIYSTKVQMRLFGINADLTGRKIQVDIGWNETQYDTLINNDDDSVINNLDDDIVTVSHAPVSDSIVFEGYIESCEEDAIGGDFLITAYDYFYYARDIDVSAWWNSYIATNSSINLMDMSQSLLNYMGLTTSNQSAISYQISFTKLHDVYQDSITSLRFGDIFSMICEIACVIPIFTGFKNIYYLTFDNNTIKDLSDNVEKLETTFEKYEVESIDSVYIYGSSSELLYAHVNSGTEGENPYRIVGNLLLNASTTAELTNIAGSIYTKVTGIVYTPAHLQLIESIPALFKPQQITNKLIVNNHTVIISSIKTYGSQSIEMEIDCKAKGQKREGDTYNPYGEIVSNQRISKISRDLNNVTIEVGEVAKTTARILEVTRTTVDSNNRCIWVIENPPSLTYSEVSTPGFKFAITVPSIASGDADKNKYIMFLIDSQVFGYFPIYIDTTQVTNQLTSGETIYFDYLERQVGPTTYEGFYVSTADSYSQAQIKVLKDTVVLKVEESTGKIVKVALSADATGSAFKVKADNIDFIADGKIQLTSSSLAIDSTYFKVTATGVLTCTKGEIGGWTIGTYKISGGDASTGVAVMQMPTSNTTWVFGAGGTRHDSYLDCPFKVSKNGSVFAKYLNLNDGTHDTMRAPGTAYFGWDAQDNAVHMTFYKPSGGVVLGLNGATGKISTSGEIEADSNITTNAFFNGKLSEGGMPITTTATDIVSNWGAQGVRSYFYGPDGALNGKPTNYGHLLTLGHDSEVGQLWLEAPSGIVYKRGGNANGFSSWTYLLDSTMFTEGGQTYNYNKIPFVKSEGGMEIGRYIDFHANISNDKDARIAYSSTNDRLEASPSIVSTSSRKVKKNIDDITDDEANLILKLRPRKFDFKSTQTDNQNERGFIAEEVQEIIPNLVCEEEGEEGTKNWMPMALKYEDIIAYLVKVVQRQEREINKLKGE